MYLVIDRFEGSYAICEDEEKNMISMEKEKLPKEAKEGDVLFVSEERIIIDYEETNKRKKEIEKIIDDLWE
ncbi:DUF3006 domain-containing protein [Inediibacterium massiliense]|uniref:DUF3006 domain-containing protein n=1 Tax=Inediibacterium massiliense TaxID=1658111 RepID=UPI0006B5471D|nr:DUF3006 domain-containing protein [Inediibacterium massiliense]